MNTEPRLQWVHGLPEITTSRLLLRLAREDEASKLHRYAVRNREHLRPWEITRPQGFYELSYWKPVPAEEIASALRYEGVRFRAFLTSTQSEILGVVSIRDVVHGEVQSAQLGYSLDAGFTGRGFMTEAVNAVVRYAFREFRLHRIEACCMPSNLPSIRVLEKTGFQKEGLLRHLLRIDGKWEDHLMWSLLDHEVSK